MDVEAEIHELKRRVSALESPFGALTSQVGGVHKDLLAFEARTEQRFEQVGRLDQMDGSIDRVETELRGLRQDMPRIVGDTMREVLRERDAQSQK